MIEGKHIIVGVTGGIAAYKAAALVSLLKKRGADVHVCMTKNAQQFVSPLTFETLSVNRVVTDTFSREAPFEVEHVSLAKLADLIVVAPATANILAKAAQGLADDFLSTLLLAARSPVLFAPAMNTAMLHHPAVQRNLAQLRADGRLFVAPGTGMLACGDVGDGRMAEPEEIADAIEAALTPKDMQGVRLLVTAGSHARTTGRCALPFQPFDGQDGLCHRGRGGGAWCRGDAHKRAGHPPAAVWRALRVGGERAADVRGLLGRLSRRGHRCQGGGRGGLHAGALSGREDQKER